MPSRESPDGARSTTGWRQGRSASSSVRLGGLDEEAEIDHRHEQGLGPMKNPVATWSRCFDSA